MTTAFVDRSRLTLTGDLSVLADPSQVIAGFATAGSISVSTNNSGFGIAGSGVVNMIRSTTEAYAKDSFIDVDGKISILALDESLIVGGAGSLSVAVSSTDQKTDTGAAKAPQDPGSSFRQSAAISVIDSTIRAYASDSTLVAAGKIDVEAVSSQTVVSPAALPGRAPIPTRAASPWPDPLPRPST